MVRLSALRADDPTGYSQAVFSIIGSIAEERIARAPVTEVLRTQLKEVILTALAQPARSS
jgi:hypothetical protein